MMWMFFLQCAVAGTIGIQTSHEVSISEKAGLTSVNGKISVVNAGNEMAREVYLEILAPDIKSPFVKYSIEPGQQKSWDFAEQVKSAIQDQVPVVFMLNYQDVNGYQFSAPSVAIAQSAQLNVAGDSIIVSATQQREDDGEYKLSYTIKNNTADKLRLEPKLVLPKELKLMTREAPIEIEGQSESAISFQVADKKALKGSRYNVFLVLKWQDSRGQRAQSFNDAIEIRDKMTAGLYLRFEDVIFFILAAMAVVWSWYTYRYWALPTRTSTKSGKK